MKTLKESILGDEDDLMDEMGDSVIKADIFKYNDSLRLRSKKPGCDRAENKLKVGDWVMFDYLYDFRIGQIVNFNKSKNKCNIICRESDIEWIKTLTSKNEFFYRTMDLLKVDEFKALEFLKNPLKKH